MQSIGGVHHCIHDSNPPTCLFIPSRLQLRPPIRASVTKWVRTDLENLNYCIINNWDRSVLMTFWASVQHAS